MNAVQWWCSARGIPWTWTWQAYPGVWLVVLVAGISLVRATRGRSAKQKLLGAVTMLLLLVTLDWPVGPLGAGYLASVHALQFVMLAMVIPALWLLATREDAPLAVATQPERRAMLQSVSRVLGRPLIAALLFTVVMSLTHVPRVVDALMANQAGSFALDALWLISGWLFWHPVLARHPNQKKFTVPMQMLYLFLGTQVHLLIAMWLLTAEFPVYATYELSPRVVALSALQDQQVAGGVMLLLGAPIILVVISVLFFRWFSGAETEPHAAT